MKPTITMIAFEDVEKAPAMSRRFVRHMAAWHRAAIASGRVQLIIVSQREESPELNYEIATAQLGRHVAVIQADHPRDASGYPVWDICKSVRKVWPMVAGEYVTFSHMEYCHGTGLLKTAEHLAATRPMIALGNLRRLGQRLPGQVWTRSDECRLLDGIIKEMIDDEEWIGLACLWKFLPTVHWVYWRDSPAAEGWEEDIFFARRDWLDALRFFEHGGELPFQDVYDLMGAALNRLSAAGRPVACPRLPRHVHEAIHLIHPRLWGSFTTAMRDYFLNDPCRWHGTTMGNAALWERALAPGALDSESQQSAVAQFRNGPGGTVWRWLADFTRHVKTLS